MNVDPRLPLIKSSLYRVSVKAIIIRDKRVLFVKDGDDLHWSFPGGGVDYGENTHEALTRELMEELGVPHACIEPDFIEIGTVIGHERDGIPRCNIHFLVKLVAEKVQVTDEISDLKWFTLQEIEDIQLDGSAGDISDILQRVKELLAQ